MLNLKKFERMCVLAFENAIRLHNDSILLYNNQSYPSSYALSVISLEELGKFSFIQDFVWHNRVDSRYDPKDEEKIIKLIFSHRHKQMAFCQFIDYPMVTRKGIEKVYNGLSEINKQNSLYVGLPRKSGKINLKGKITNPIKITESKAKEQITVVNDFFVCLTAGVINEYYGLDIIEVEELLTQELLNSFKNNWSHMSYSAKREFNRLMYQK